MFRKTILTSAATLSYRTIILTEASPINPEALNLPIKGDKSWLVASNCSTYSSLVVALNFKIYPKHK